MPFEFKLTRRVEFHETDMAGIVHFSHFFRYMESVEHAFYRSLGFSVVMHQLNPALGLPRVHASCDYRRPLHFEDLFEMHLLVREKRSRSLSYTIRFRRIEPGPVEEVAVGVLAVACVSRDPKTGFACVSLPDKYFHQVTAAPAELFEAGGDKPQAR